MADSDVRIRAATVDDAAAIADAEYRTAAAGEGLLAARPREIPVSAFREKIRGISERRSEGLYVVAEAGDELRGHLMLEPLPLQSLRHVVGLTIVVHPGHTRRGLGRRLMQHAIDWARHAEHVEKIELNVRSTNPGALALYEQLGFVVEGVRRRRIKLSNGYADDVGMALFVPGDPS